MKQLIAAWMTALCMSTVSHATPFASDLPLIGIPSPVIQVRELCGAGFHRIGGRCVRNVVARPPLARPWVRPHYHWRPGAAIAAGAAIGFVAATTAAAWAGSPPAANLCWYYTDPSRRQGFWDFCP